MLEEIDEFLNTPFQDKLLPVVGYKLYFPMEVKDDISLSIPRVKRSLVDMTLEDPQGLACNMMIDQLKEELDDGRKDRED